MQIFDAPSERIAPFIHLLVCKRHRVDAIRFHQGMRRSLGTMRIKFFFEQCIHRAIEIERISWRLADAKPTIEIKTSRTV